MGIPPGTVPSSYPSSLTALAVAQNVLAVHVISQIFQNVNAQNAQILTSISWK